MSRVASRRSCDFRGAHWLGTTEARPDLLLDFVGVGVLEAGACCVWYFAALRPILPGCAVVASDRNSTVLRQEAVVPILDAAPVIVLSELPVPP
ncbi:hypothetical protein [Burkholderia cepacia]|uniref:hypothetical protein n=1 Tax=Burkholderia cepacia TaxID=292 RepID=UPI0015924AFA|nr:hypothetical protein [Burkholderia cepacia]